MAIDFHCNLFTHASIKKNWYDTPDMYRVIKWWKMEDRVQGKTIAEFIAMLDEAGCDKALLELQAVCVRAALDQDLGERFRRRPRMRLAS